MKIVIDTDDSLDKIVKLLGEIMITLKDVQDKQTQNIAALQAETDVETAIMNLVQSDSALIASLQAQLAAAIAAGAGLNQVEAQALLDSMQATQDTMVANKAKIAAAVLAGAQK